MERMPTTKPSARVVADADLGAKLVAHPRLALGDAVHLWLVQGVDLVPALGCLPQQASHPVEPVAYRRTQRPFNSIDLTLDVTQDPARVAPQRAQRLAHAAELPGVGVTPDPGGQARRLAVVVLSQADPSLPGQGDEGAARHRR